MIYDPSILCWKFSLCTCSHGLLLLCFVMFLCFEFRLFSILFACLTSSPSVGNDKDISANIYCIIVVCFYVTVQAIAFTNAFAVSMNGTVCIDLS